MFWSAAFFILRMSASVLVCCPDVIWRLWRRIILFAWKLFLQIKFCQDFLYHSSHEDLPTGTSVYPDLIFLFYPASLALHPSILCCFALKPRESGAWAYHPCRVADDRLRVLYNSLALVFSEDLWKTFGVVPVSPCWYTCEPKIYVSVLKGRKGLCL